MVTCVGPAQGVALSPRDVLLRRQKAVGSLQVAGRLLLFSAVIAIVVAVLVVIGINAMPGNEVAETIPTMPN